MDKEPNLNYENPELRAKVASYEREVAHLRMDNQELTESLYNAYKKMKELNEEIERLKNVQKM